MVNGPVKILLCLTLFGTLGGGLWSEPSGYPWKMAVVKSASGKDVSLPFAKPLTLANHDQFRLVIVPEAAGSLTVLYEDPSGTVTALFHEAVKENQLVILPGVAQAFEISPPSGTERFHIIIGATSQEPIVRLLKGLPQASAQILDAVAALKSSLAALAEAPERPVPMGGTHRGLADAPMTEFQGKVAYVKTIRFDH